MKRREFCRQVALVGGAVVLTPLIKGCAPLTDPTARERSVAPGDAARSCDGRALTPSDPDGCAHSDGRGRAHPAAGRAHYCAPRIAAAVACG